ncbi:MAG: hypothetical protein E7021_02125 [Alphaproteobacteria bacterium]|nr:hypothetical protein [Alphaproteobacteria bacterium]
MKIKHSVGDLSLECEIFESENPPELVSDDYNEIFINKISCEYFLLRKRVYEMLTIAHKHLPKGYKFKAFELYRPFHSQVYYWKCILDELRNKNPYISDEELYEKANIFIANPYKQGSGHQTGAAIDLTLCDEQGRELDMGTKWREFNSKTKTFSLDPTLTEEQKQNRKMLYDAMIIAGFVNYFEEWWHFSYGEIEWAVITRIGKTLYAPLKI